jgi:hypothetical protein
MAGMAALTLCIWSAFLIDRRSAEIRARQTREGRIRGIDTLHGVATREIEEARTLAKSGQARGANALAGSAEGFVDALEREAPEAENRVEVEAWVRQLRGEIALVRSGSASRRG